MKEAITIENIEDSLEECTKKKCKHNADFVDVSAKNDFTRKIQYYQ